MEHINPVRITYFLAKTLYSFRPRRTLVYIVYLFFTHDYNSTNIQIEKSRAIPTCLQKILAPLHYTTQIDYLNDYFFIFQRTYTYYNKIYHICIIYVEVLFFKFHIHCFSFIINIAKW